MPYNFHVSQEAEDDILEAYLWYEKQRQGLGEEFLECLDRGHQAIINSPSTYRTRYKKKVRAFLVDRFPFLILYIFQNEDVNVIGVFNTSRNPKIWKKRIK